MISDIIKAISRRTDAHELFIRTAAYSIMSNNLGEYINIPVTGKNLRANIYTMLIGPPHASRKSTVLNYIKIFSLINRIPTDVTYEYFINELSKTEKNVAWQLVDEATEILQTYTNSTRERDKKMQRAILLLFNNQPIERGTLSGGKVKVDNSFFNLICATTTDNANTFLSDYHTIHSGFMPRFLIAIISENELKKERMKYITDDEDISNILTKFRVWRNTLEKIWKESTIKIFFNSVGFDMINDFEERIIKKMSDSFLVPFVTRYTDYIMKIASIEELNVELEDSGRLMKKIIVSEASITKAIQYISQLLIRIKNNFSEYIEYNNFTTTYQRILSMLKKRSIFESEIYNKAHADAQTTRKVLETLNKQEKLFIINKDGKNKYFYKPEIKKK